MPRGEPTQVVRLPRWFVEHLTPQAAERDLTVPELIVQRLSPRAAAVTPGAPGPARCTCKTPTISKVVTNLCTTCRRLR